MKHTKPTEELATLKTVKTAEGKTFHLGLRLGKGGEGEVFHVKNDPNLAIKLYNKGKATEREQKIQIMVANKYHQQTSYVAFPIDSLFTTDTHRFVGFTMSKMIDVKPIHALHAPGSRKKEFPRVDFRFLLRTALNIARAVASIHETGCVIGDINQSGILVSTRATVMLIDSDSFQITLGKMIYRCPVGVLDYTPPELQNINLETIDRTPNHDNFGLAVSLFLLLFMGWHPFSGRYLGSGEMSIAKAIEEGRFAYSLRRRADIKMEPPRWAPLLTDFPQDIVTAFEDAFQPIGTSFVQRPSAAQWVRLLEQMENTLIPCQVTHAHYHSRETRCPWCRLEGIRGSNLFPVPTTPPKEHTILHPTNFDITKVLAAINRVAKPQAPPELRTILKPFQPLKRSPMAQKAHNTKMQKVTLCIIMFIIGLLLFIL